MNPAPPVTMMCTRSPREVSCFSTRAFGAKTRKASPPGHRCGTAKAMADQHGSSAGQRSLARGSDRQRALDLFASCAPGLEPLLAGEVAALGLAGRAVPGGVELRGDLGVVARLNLWLRTASRVLVRLGSVRATSFAALVKEARALPFELAVGAGTAVGLRVTCRNSRPYHSPALARRLHPAPAERPGRPRARRASHDQVQ